MYVPFGKAKYEFVIIATGAEYPQTFCDRTEIYNILEDTWVEGPKINQPRTRHTSVVVQNKYLYIIAGNNSSKNQKLDSIERLDMTALELKWEPINIFNDEGKSGWRPRDSCGSFAVENKIIIFGGNSGWNSE